jgi:uncharacterized protein
VFQPLVGRSEYILGFFQQHTAVQSTNATKDYIGKWMKVAGPVGNVLSSLNKRSGEMSEQQNVELIKSAYAAFTRDDRQTLLDLISGDVDFQHPMPRSIWPWAGHSRGRDAFARFLDGLAQTTETERLEPREFIAQGDKLVVLMFERFRIKATGIAVDNSYVHVFTIKNGKVAQFLVFEDTAPIIAALQGGEKRF